jgi:hypothetical protein
MNKIAIAMDIVRQYSERLNAFGEETKLYTIDGYGERVSFRDLVLGYLYAFCNIYGEAGSWYGYPKYLNYTLNILYGDGIIGWNRVVTNPVIDIPKALKIYDHLSATAASYKDKYARFEVFKKMFYRNGTKYHNYFLDGTDALNSFGQYLSSGILLYNENQDFYNYCKSKIDNFAKLAANEAKNVSVPTKLKYLFDSKPVATMYDAEPADESYKDGLLNINSVIIQANQFYLTFLTSFEQILYQYTRQTFPLKLLGTLTNLYSSYTKLIVNYLKPYHARMIDLAPIIRFGSDISDTMSVGDQLTYNLTQQIYTDVYEWNFDNPYDYRPNNYDQMKKITEDFYFGGSPDDEDNPGITYQLIDEWRYNHRIDEKLWYTDKFDKDIFEDFNVIVDSQEQEVGINTDDIPVEIYPSILYTTLSKYDSLAYDFVTGTIENLLDRDLVLITKQYNSKDQYRLTNIKTVKQDIDENISRTKMLVLLDDIYHGFTSEFTYTVIGERFEGEYVINPEEVSVIKYTRMKIPKVNDIFRGNKPPVNDMSQNPIWKKLNSNQDLTREEIPLIDGYHNFIRVLIYLPAHCKAVLPKFTYECRIKHYT